MNAAASESCVYRLLCARMVPAGEFVVGTGCIGAAKERRNDDEVCERTSSPATLKPGAKVKAAYQVQGTLAGIEIPR
jgi:hypothetical protein